MKKWIFVVLGAMIPFGSNCQATKPKDIIFLKILLFGITLSCNSQTRERSIVLINADTLDRKGIANIIKVVNPLSPRVISIDFQFSSNKNYSHDLRLIEALDECKNLVMISVIENYDGKKEEYIRHAFGSLPIFLTNAQTGFSNTILENDDLETLERFSAYEKVNGEIEYHFGVRVAMAYDSLKAVDFVRNNPRIIVIDYKNGNRKFNSFSSSDVLNGKLTEMDIKDKIVMIGFLGPGDEDKFYTPLNTNPAEPDMYGLEYLANIVAQVLEYR